MTPEIKARIEADMEAASKMEFRELIGFVSGYTARFDAEIRQGEVLREAIRAYADETLVRLMRANDPQAS